MHLGRREGEQAKEIWELIKVEIFGIRVMIMVPGDFIPEGAFLIGFFELGIES